MSVLDDLRGLETRVTKRMNELRPLVDEYRELERVAQRLGLQSDGVGSAPPSADDAATSTTEGSRSRTAGKRSQGRSRTTARASRAAGGRTAAASTARRRANAAPAGERREQVLAAVNERPGITVREIGQQLGVHPTSLYRSVRQLERDGTIDKRGPRLHPR
jgi:hypothetical protein